MNTSAPSRSSCARRAALLLLLPLLLGLGAACSPKINIVRDHSEPLQEYVLQGKGRDKIVLIHLRGTISTSPRSGLLSEDPSPVQEVTSRLRKAARDEAVKAVVLAIDSPGGSVTASDILYEEIKRYKRESKAKVVALLMGLAASGGYYAAVAADRIVAHPTSITGSIGTVYIRPDLVGLMEKVGVQAEVTKSGKYKDISSWFRHSSEEERTIMQEMIDQLNARFLKLVQENRKLGETQLKEVAGARVFTAEQALELGLVDSLGYADDAFALAGKLAGLGKGLGADAEEVKVVAYRREKFADDTPYNAFATSLDTPAWPLMDGASRVMRALEPGFHYLWLSGAGL